MLIESVQNFRLAEQRYSSVIGALPEDQLDEIIGTLSKLGSAVRGAAGGAREGGWTGLLAGAGEGWRQRRAAQQAAAQRVRGDIGQRFGRARELADVIRSAKQDRDSQAHQQALAAAQRRAERIRGAAGPGLFRSLARGAGSALSAAASGAAKRIAAGPLGPGEPPKALPAPSAPPQPATPARPVSPAHAAPAKPAPTPQPAATPAFARGSGTPRGGPMPPPAQTVPPAVPSRSTPRKPVLAAKSTPSAKKPPEKAPAAVPGMGRRPRKENEDALVRGLLNYLAG